MRSTQQVRPCHHTKIVVPPSKAFHDGPSHWNDNLLVIPHLTPLSSRPVQASCPSVLSNRPILTTKSTFDCALDRLRNMALHARAKSQRSCVLFLCLWAFARSRSRRIQPSCVPVDYRKWRCKLERKLTVWPRRAWSMHVPFDNRS